MNRIKATILRICKRLDESATKPAAIIEDLEHSVDHFIIGSMQYCDVPRSFYAKPLPALISWLDENKINYYLKRELKSCLAV